MSRQRYYPNSKNSHRDSSDNMRWFLPPLLAGVTTAFKYDQRLGQIKTIEKDLKHTEKDREIVKNEFQERLGANLSLKDAFTTHYKTNGVVIQLKGDTVAEPIIVKRKEMEFIQRERLDNANALTDEINGLKTSIEVKQKELLPSAAKDFARDAALFYLAMLVPSIIILTVNVVIFLKNKIKMSLEKKKAVKQLRAAYKKAEAEKQNPPEVAVTQPAVPIARIALTRPQTVVEKAYAELAPEKSVEQPKPITRPIPRPKAVPKTEKPVSGVSDGRVAATIMRIIGAKFEMDLPDIKPAVRMVLEGGIQDMRYFVKQYLEYLKKPEGTRGAFAQNGMLGTFREKWKVEGKTDFGQWRVFSSRVNGSGRVVLAISIAEKKIALFEATSNHPGYVSSLLDFDPKRINFAVDIDVAKNPN
ncbi:MAG: hypothetical protein V1492_05580 [Candidatus Micrarchaeota archaeon]